MIKNYDTKKKANIVTQRVHNVGHCDKKIHQCQAQKCTQLGVHGVGLATLDGVHT